MGRPWAQAYFNREHGAWTVGYWQDSGRAGAADSWTTFPTEEDAKAAAARYNVSNRPAAEMRMDATAIANVHSVPGVHSERYKISEPPRDDHSIVTMMFRDTITGRMMRWLADRGEVTQAAFMDEYHRRCERTNPSRSSFGNNFGRFTYGKFHVITVLRKQRHNRLCWCGPTQQQVIKILTCDPKLQGSAYGAMERILTCDARNSDDEQETYRWLVIARDLKGEQMTPITPEDHAVAIVFKHEDEVRRQPVGPVWKRLKNGTLVNYRDHETMTTVVSKKPYPKWFTLAQAKAFARDLNVPCEES